MHGQHPGTEGTAWRGMGGRRETIGHCSPAVRAREASARVAPLMCSVESLEDLPVDGGGWEWVEWSTCLLRTQERPHWKGRLSVSAR